MKKTAAESHRILVKVYGEHALAERTCQKWFARFKSGDFGLEDEEGPGQPKKFEDEEQLIRLKRAIAEKRPEYATRHEAIIFHHDNACPHVAIPVKNYLENRGWEVLPHPPYSLDLAPSDYHLFRLMQNAFTEIRFTSEQGIKNWLDSSLAAKPAQFFWDGIHKLPER